MTQGRIQVVVAGGGTAGWVTACALARQLGPLLDVTLVESEEIGTIGVGEATIPTQATFHALIGLDERDFMSATQATFKLGIAFEGWARPTDRYVHSFGTIGRSPWMAHFLHVWLEGRARGLGSDLGAYCLELRAAEEGRYGDEAVGGTALNHAYHLDSGLYARRLRTLAEGAGVRRIEGRIAHVQRDARSGDVTALTLQDGRCVPGAFFVDCTGFRGLLIEDALGAGFEDWGHCLPTDRAVTVQTEPAGPPRPYTRAIAHEAGWRWQIPLRHRVGNGLVYASEHLGEDEATARLMSMVDAAPLTEPRAIRYRTGRRRSVWSHNCVAIGLSAGFVEPLESTAIHLIQVGVTRLIKYFPFAGTSPALRDRFNALARVEIERVRDFVLLHYKLTERDDSAFWRAHREAVVPDSLAARIALFEEHAHAYQGPEDLFQPDSWVQVMLGQRLAPRGRHGVGAMMSDAQLGQALLGLERRVDAALAKLPRHEDFLARYCPPPIA